MKKRIVLLCISLVMLLTLSGGSGLVYAEDHTELALSGMEKVGGIAEVGDKVRFRMEDESILNPGLSAIQKAAPSTAALKQFSLADKLPAVRDQGSSDNCWTYGALASLESNLITKGLANKAANLSENHLTWFTYKGENASAKSAYAGNDTFMLTQSNSPYEEGGNRWFSTATLARGYGAVNHSRAPSAKSLSSSLRTTSDVKLKNAYFLPDPSTSAGISAIKQHLTTKGAVDVSYYVDSPTASKYLSSNYAYYYNGRAYANHEVAIVGWDDTYSSKKFKSNPNPGKNGAWIVRNSWGADWGNDGYFYLSYYDTGLCDPTFYEAASTKNEFSSIYQYDGVGSGDAEFNSYSKTSAANRYMARNDVLLKAIGTYTSAANSTVNVSIYASPSAATPTSGVKKYSKAFSVSYAGYHTLDLGQTIGIPKGYTFSVVISTSYTKGGRKQYFLPAETANDDYYLASSIDFSKGQSYIDQGRGWYDVTRIAPIRNGSDRYEIGNALAKGMGVSSGTASQTVSVPRTSYSKTYGNKAFKLNAKRTKGNGALLYKSSNTSVAAVSSSGTVSIKGPGKATITVAAAPNSTYKSTSRNVTVTVKPQRTTISSAKSKSYRTLYVKWKRNSKASGYQVVIAKNKSFKSGKKSATITKNSTTSKTFKKLSSRKNYYVKVRAYKTVSGKKLYGSYSKVKRVKTR